MQTVSDVEAVSRLIASELGVKEDVLHGSFGDSEAFGYASRHLIVELIPPRAELAEWRRYEGLQCEIQVRTILQHAWASISHSLLYKVEDDIPSIVQRRLSQVAALIEVGDGLFEQFRSDVQDLRSKYVTEANVADNSWREIAINLDSLEATWDKWKPRWLIGHPFKELPHCYVLDQGLVHGEKYPDPQLISGLARQASRRQLKNLGELGEFLEGQAFRKSVLKMVKRTTPESGIGTISLDFLVGIGAYEDLSS